MPPQIQHNNNYNYTKYKDKVKAELIERVNAVCHFLHIFLDDDYSKCNVCQNKKGIKQKGTVQILQLRNCKCNAIQK